MKTTRATEFVTNDLERIATADEPQCRDVDPEGWLCCRPKGHFGDHIAFDLDEPFVRWKQRSRDGA